jgi:uncharacterized membrane protein YdbT with pleckstrin-like domain
MRPVFVGWIALVVQLPMQLFLSVWAGGFFGGFSKSLIGLQGKAPFFVFGLLAFFGVPCVAYFGKKLNYGRTAYRFFEDHLEFEEGFFSRNRKIIAYRDILEVSLRKGLLQQTCDLGSIYLATVATGSSPQSNAFLTLGFGNVSASGVGVRDVREPDAAFERIRTWVDASKRSKA